MKNNSPKAKPLPMRTCIACRQPQAKGALIRIVRTPEGRIILDPTSKKAGRGAYLCNKTSCWDIAIKRDKMEHALRSKISLEDRRAIEEFINTLPPEDKTPSVAMRAK